MEKKLKKKVVWLLLIIPLIGVAIWLIKLLVAYFTPVPPGVEQAPVNTTYIIAMAAFMLVYSIFLALFALKGSKD